MNENGQGKSSQTKCKNIVISMMLQCYFVVLRDSFVITNRKVPLYPNDVSFFVTVIKTIVLAS